MRMRASFDSQTTSGARGREARRDESESADCGAGRGVAAAGATGES
jgi:hypothetical protein